MARLLHSNGDRRRAVEDNEEIEEGSSQPQEDIRVKNEKKSKSKGKEKEKSGKKGRRDDADEVDEERAAADREDQEDIAMAKEIVSLPLYDHVLVLSMFFAFLFDAIQNMTLLRPIFEC